MAGRLLQDPTMYLEERRQTYSSTCSLLLAISHPTFECPVASFPRGDALCLQMNGKISKHLLPDNSSLPPYQHLPRLLRRKAVTHFEFELNSLLPLSPETHACRH